MSDGGTSELELAPLPYPKVALAPHVSSRTVEIHYEKHHRGYVDKVRKAVQNKPEGEHDLEQLIRTAEGDLYNHAAQVWNHDFYWRSMRPDGGGKPEGRVLDALEGGFGSFESFKQTFAEAANGEFGSGWAWLVLTRSGRLRVLSSSDADNPLRNDQTPLLTLDVWEHAYYLDHQNERDRYVRSFLDHLVNWDWVDENLRAAGR